MDSRTLERLAKLLRLANSANPHEAAAAQQRAQHLLDQLPPGALDVVQDPVRAHTDAPLETSRRLRRWRVALANVLGVPLQCTTYVQVGTRKTGGDRLIPVGRQKSVDTLRQHYQEWIPRIDWLTLEFCQGRDRDWTEGFRFGVLDAFTEEPPSPQVPALLPTQAMERSALEEFVASELNLKPGRTLHLLAEAYAQGRIAGRERFFPHGHRRNT